MPKINEGDLSVRIGELENAVGKELVGRRAAMAAELSRLGSRLNEPAHGATAPAVSGVDTVHISAEARAVQFTKAPELALGPFPSPAALVSVLKEIAANPPADFAPALAKLTLLVQRLATAFPGSAPTASPKPGESAAAELVAALIRLPAPAPGVTPGGREFERLGVLVRELLAAAEAAHPGTAPGVVPTTAFERATALILVAAGRAGAQVQPGVLGQAEAEGFPAALLGMFGQPAPRPVVRRPRRTRRRTSHEDAPAEGPGLDGYGLPEPGSRRQ